MRSFVALGDSFSEGLGDPYSAGDGAAGLLLRSEGFRGWADRFAERLAARSPGLRYANLALRGKLLGQVADEQVPRAVAMAPDLVSLAAGGNDLLRPRADPDALARLADETVARLTAAGSRVLLFTGFDPCAFPLIRLIRGRTAAYNMQLRAIAARRGCLLVDLWAMRVLADPRQWCADRLHMAPDGHRRVALRACEVVGLPVDEDWREPPWPDQSSGPRATARAGAAAPADRAAAVARAAGWLAQRRQDAVWAREHAGPWVVRRLRGVSSGDGMLPKRPELAPL